MWKLGSLKLANFMSHYDSELPLPEKEAHMIIGINNDDDGQESNGSGKSVANEAIALAITGTALRKVKDCDLIYYGEEQAQVTLFLENKILDKEMKITRTLFAKKSKSSTLEVWVNGEEVTEFPTVKDGNAWILDKIGVTREDLLNYYLVSEKSASFFTASDTIKKKIVARFSNTDVLLPIKDQIKEDGKELVQVREGLELELAKLQERKLVYEEQLTNASTEDAEKVKQGRIDMIQRSIDQYQSKMEEAAESTEALNKAVIEETERLESIKAELNNVEESEDYSEEIAEMNQIVQDAEEEVSTLDGKILSVRKEIRSSENLISDLESKIESSIQCPSCSHEFVLRDSDFDVDEAKEIIEGTRECLVDFKDEIYGYTSEREGQEEIIREAKSGIKDFNQEMNKAQEARQTIERKISAANFSIKSKEDKVSMLVDSYEECEQKIAEAKDKIEQVKSEKIEDPSIEINKSIKVVEDQIQDKCSEIDVAKDNIVNAAEFEAIFTKFMTHLSNKAIKSIESRVNNYLQEMKSNLSVQFEGYKVLSTGKIRENISIVVLRNGAPEAFFDNYSKGERGRINVAGILALNDLLNTSTEGSKGLDFVCLDEAMDGIDSLGVGSVMKAINTLGQPILAVSHIEPKEPFQNTIFCIKEKGISKFE